MPRLKNGIAVLFLPLHLSLLGVSCKPAQGPTPLAQGTQAPAVGVNAPLGATLNPIGGSGAVTCPSGSEAANASLRDCCLLRSQISTCNDACWPTGTSQDLAKSCKAEIKTGNDCDQSPSKESTDSWCDFHYSRRNCGVSDSEWLAACKASSQPAEAHQATGGGNDCDKSPWTWLVINRKAWCDFHLIRRYCGVSDTEWIRHCEPDSPSEATRSTASPASSGQTTTTRGGATAPCRLANPSQRGWPVPPCPKRNTARECVAGPDGSYCKWYGN